MNRNYAICSCFSMYKCSTYLQFSSSNKQKGTVITRPRFKYTQFFSFGNDNDMSESEYCFLDSKNKYKLSANIIALF
jgi:hypothetical protein